MDSLIEILYTISSALMVPVIVMLLGLLAWCLLEVGGLLREWQDRRRTATNWSSLQGRLVEQQVLDAESVAALFAGGDYPGLVGSFVRRGRESLLCPITRGKLMADAEIAASGRLAAMNFGVRLGPMLGLMGTLIPLGPALLGLSQENIEVMSRSLVVAFGTTVLGLLIGGICYAMLLVRRQWYAQDLADLDFVDRCLNHSGVPVDGHFERHEPAPSSRPQADAVHRG